MTRNEKRRSPRLEKIATRLSDRQAQNRVGSATLLVLTAGWRSPQSDEATMSKITNGIFCLLAASAAFGGVQLASGSDLAPRAGIHQVSQTVIAQSSVNRAGKSDRASLANPASGGGRTVSFQSDGVSGISVLLRVPGATAPVETARNGTLPAAQRSESRRSMVACEPVVSVLAAVAKQLPPGRCLT